MFVGAVTPIPTLPVDVILTLSCAKAPLTAVPKARKASGVASSETASINALTACDELAPTVLASRDSNAILPID